jgi:hypothetical protein
MCATFRDVSFQKAIVLLTDLPQKPIMNRNVQLNDREDIIAKWKNDAMRNFVMILREFNYAVAVRLGRRFGPVVRQSTK